jgi:segregation and condensation protein A
MSDAKSQTYTTELDGIRAPLGVILYLIRRDNLDIYDIPIAKITREYLDYLNMMEEMQIELAGEFFVLAATLMRIKSQMLLRRDDDAEDDPREGLVRSLLEYKKMVEAAKAFGEIADERTKVFTRPVPDAEKQYREEPEIDLSLYHLMRAFQEVMTQFEAADVREIELEEYTIEQRIEAITAALNRDSQVLFGDLFTDSGGRMELIVTFMALLEMVKHGHVRVRQEGTNSSIWLYQGPNFGQKLESVEDWFEATGAPEPAGDTAEPQDNGPESRHE